MKSNVLLIFLLIIISLQAGAMQGYSKISGSSDILKDGDAVILIVHKYSSFYSNYLPFYTSDTVRAKNHSYQFEWRNEGTPQYVDLYYVGKGYNVLNAYIINGGEEVTITENQGNCRFSGLSTSSFAVQQKIRRVYADILKSRPIDFLPETMQASYHLIDSSARMCLAALNKDRLQIKPLLYDLLKVDILTGAEWEKDSQLSGVMGHYMDSGYIAYRHEMAEYNKKPKLDLDFSRVDSSVLLYSLNYSGYVYNRYLIDSIMVPRVAYSVHHYYRYLTSHFTGALRDQLVTVIFWRRKNYSEDTSRDIDSAIAYIQNPDYKNLLKQIRALNTIGSPAYEFALKDVHGKIIHLSDFRGKLVILDFWFNGCGACRAMAPVLYKLEQKFENQQVVFISINADKEKERWLAGLKGNLYSSPLCVNVYTGGKGSNDSAVQRYTNGFPTIVFIDKKGRLGPNPPYPISDDGKGLENLINKYLQD